MLHKQYVFSQDKICLPSITQFTLYGNNETKVYDNIDNNLTNKLISNGMIS